MRRMSLLLMTAAVAACSTYAPPADHAAKAQAELQRLTQGRVVSGTVSCLPSYTAAKGQMVVIDNNTVAFRNVGGDVYINHMHAGSCYGLGSGFYALKTTSHGGLGLCSGDPAQVIDTSTGYSVGTCVLGEFTQYKRP